MSVQTRLDIGEPAEDATDDELLDDVRSGSRAAFARLYARHQAKALRVARRNTRQTADAEDVVSDAFAQTYSAIAAGGGPKSNFGGYVLTAVRNGAIKATASGRRLLPTGDVDHLDTSLPAAEDVAVQAAESAELVDILTTLPERWQQVLWRTQVDGDPPREVAEDFGTSANSVSALTRRAREGLQLSYLGARTKVHGGAVTSTQCDRTLAAMPALVKGKLGARRSVVAVEHIDGCEACAVALNDLEDCSSRMRGLAWPLLLIGLGRERLEGVWFSSSAGKAAIIGGGALVASGAVFLSVQAANDTGTTDRIGVLQTSVSDVTEDSSSTQRTYEVEFINDRPRRASFIIELDDDMRFNGTYESDFYCTRSGNEVECTTELDATGVSTWEFHVETSSAPDSLPVVTAKVEH